MKFQLLVTTFGLFSHAVFGLCVSDEKANLRAGPGIEYAATWEAIRYMPLKKLGKTQGWYQVEDLDGKKHYIKETLVTTAFECVQIKDEWARLRAGPGTQFKEKMKAEKYLSFRLLQSKGSWLKIEDIEGDEFWVRRDLVWMGTSDS